jgi:Tol biopolymer transport system component
MAVDGSEPVNLTHHPADDRSPAWSPDGRGIAFHSNRDGNYELYVLDLQGGLVRLTDTEADERNPARSPGGAPGGERLALDARDDGGWQIYLMNLDGSGRTALTDSLDVNSRPAWSPSGAPGGERIAFTAEDKHYSSSIRVVRLDGEQGTGEAKRLTLSDTYHDMHPAWSPDGARLAYASEKTGHLKFEIFVMALSEVGDAGPSPPVQLTELGGRAWYPDWSPDGQQIVFAFAAGTDDQEIYAMDVPERTDAGGANIVVLTDNRAEDSYPRSSPAP